MLKGNGKMDVGYEYQERGYLNERKFFEKASVHTIGGYMDFYHSSIPCPYPELFSDEACDDLGWIPRRWRDGYHHTFFSRRNGKEPYAKDCSHE
jgi:hypothetical protein